MLSTQLPYYIGYLKSRLLLKSKQSLSHLSFGILLLTLAFTASANDYVWKANPNSIEIDGDRYAPFELTENWNRSLPPPSSPDVNLTFQRCAFEGRDCEVSPVNLTANRRVGDVVFNEADFRATADFNLQGESLVVYNRIANNSDSTQTINNNIVTGDERLFIANHANGDSFNLLGNLNLNGSISGEGQVVYLTNGKDKIVLRGNNTYTGGTRLAQGAIVELASTNTLYDKGSVHLTFDSILNLVGAQTIGSLSGDPYSDILGNNRSLTINQTGLSIFDGNISGTGDLIKKGSGPLVLRGNNQGLTGTIFIQEGLIIIGNNPVAPRNVVAGALDISQGAVFDMNGFSETVGNLSGAGVVGRINGRLTVNQKSNTTFSGELIGGGLFEKTGDGTLTLAGNNTFTGKTHIKQGTLALGGTNALDALAGDMQIDSGAVFDMRGRTEGIDNLSGNGHIINDNLLIVSQSTNATFGGVISGAGRFVKDGVADLTLNGRNTYQGPTNINSGILSLGINNAIADTSEIIVGNAQFDLNGYSDVVGSLSGAGAINLGNGTLTVNQIRNTTYAGTINGSGSFVKDGFGKLSLTGNNTQTGDISINGGTLAITSNANLGNANARLRFNGGTLEIGPVNLKMNRFTIINGLATIQAADGGSLTHNGLITGDGDLRISSGNVTLGSDGSNYIGNTFVDTNAVLTIAESGSIVNAGNFVQMGNTVVNGYLRQQSVDIKAGTLSGTGIIEANKMTVQESAKIKPGNSTGTLILITELHQFGGLEIEIESASLYDVVAVEGGVFFTESSYFNFDFSSSYLPKSGDAFNFITSNLGFDFGSALDFDNWFNIDNFNVFGLGNAFKWRVEHFDGSQIQQTSFLSLVIFENRPNTVSAPAGLFIFTFGFLVLLAYRLIKTR